MKTLVLTSPFTRGPDVVRAQAALKRGNIFRADYLRGPQDGIFGEGTARACIRAKYWLGYSTPSQLPVYGDQLHSYLTGRKPLGPIMKLRRARRLKAAQEVPMRIKALNRARTKLGVTEYPRGSNNVEFSRWYLGVPSGWGAWCAMFVSWAYDGVGSQAFKPGLIGVDGLHPGSGTYAYVPYIVQDARAGRNGLSLVSYNEAKPGDLVCYDWDGGVADHVGILELKRPFDFDAIEGNTAVGNDSNGGEVMRRRRHLSQVQAFVRVGR